MKKTLFTMMLAVSSMANAQKPFTMEGVIEGEPDIKSVTIKVEKDDAYGEFLPEQTVEVKKGKFNFTTKTNSVVRAQIVRGEGEKAKYVTVVAVPGEKMKLSIKGDEYFYDGSKVYKECGKADAGVTPYYKDLVSYYDQALARIQTLPEDQQQDAVSKANDTIRIKQQAFQDATKKYAEDHKTEEGAMLYLVNYLNVEQVYEEMVPELKNGRVGEYYKKQIDYTVKVREERAKREAEEQAKLDAMKGKPAKDFTLNDLNGNPLSLSSLRGKYVVLDFWGSWCGWCIKGIPDMKKYYEKYAGKFEILGIDCNDTEQAWKDAVAKYELPWKHVYNPRTSTVLTDYAIQGFPTKIIIDPEGNLNKIIVGEDPAFYDYLDEILK